MNTTVKHKGVLDLKLYQYTFSSWNYFSWNYILFIMD